jgi:putative transposase
MEVEFCMAMLEEALSKGTPKIINTDQGSQFTSNIWINTLLKNEIGISMDSKGRCLDNVYAERFWRSLKQEEVYLNPYDSVSEARGRIGQYIEFYNRQRPHQSLDYKTPAEVYFAEKVDKALVLFGKNTVQSKAVGIMDNLQASYPQYPQAHQQQVCLTTD